MRIYKGNPELVFRGKVTPWYGLVSGLVAVAGAVLALQPGMPAGVPATLLVVGALLLWPVVVRNRVELYKDRLEIVFGWGRTIIPYDHVTGVRRLKGGFGDATGHNCAISPNGVFIEAPADGDAAVSVIGNDTLMTELRRRAGLGEGEPHEAATPAGEPPRKS